MPPTGKEFVKMFSAGEYAVCGMNGVCIVRGTEMRDGGLYYVFEPVSDKALRLFIPTENGTVRKPISAEQAEDLLDSISDMDDIWVNNIRERRRIYSSIMTAHDLPEVIKLAKTLYCKKCERRRDGKSMYSFEDSQLRTAERAVGGELAYALHISGDDALKLLEEKFAECACA